MKKISSSNDVDEFNKKTSQLQGVRSEVPADQFTVQEIDSESEESFSPQEEEKSEEKGKETKTQVEETPYQKPLNEISYISLFRRKGDPFEQAKGDPEKVKVDPNLVSKKTTKVNEPMSAPETDVRKDDFEKYTLKMLADKVANILGRGNSLSFKLRNSPSLSSFTSKIPKKPHQETPESVDWEAKIKGDILSQEQEIAREKALNRDYTPATQDPEYDNKYIEQVQKRIAQKKKEREERKKNGEEEEEVEESSESDSETVEALDLDIREKEILDKLQDKISDLAIKKFKTVKPLALAEFLTAEEEKVYDKYLRSKNTDQIRMLPENMYIPPSDSSIGGNTFRFLGGVLADFSDRFKEIGGIVLGLNKLGFKVPKRFLEVFGEFKPFDFHTIMEKIPFMIQKFGPTFGPMAVLAPPTPLTKLTGAQKHAVAYDMIKSMIGNFADNLSGKKIVNELMSILYVSDEIPSKEKVNEHSQRFLEAMVTSNKKATEANQRLEKDLYEVTQNPNTLANKIEGAQVLDPEKTVVLIDQDQELSRFSGLNLAKVNKTALGFDGPDLVMGTVIAYLVESPIPDFVYPIVENNYVGAGGISNLSERYNKSLKIYQESNSETNKIFHKKFYKDNYYDFVKKYGYFYDGQPLTVPSDSVAYLSEVDDNKRRLHGVNTHAKGTFTSFNKRIITGAVEINKGLEHWKNIKNDPKNESYRYFYMGFKNISAKLKDEIHSYEKPPRFFNPTDVGAFIPFQFVVDNLLVLCPPASTKCPHSLLGIADVDTNFSKIMENFYKRDNIRMHYSDNFWIKEGTQYVSVDVERCDSNLSKEALLYPLMVAGRMFLDDEWYEKFKIIVRLFVGTIPRGAILSLIKKDKFANLLLPFFWLPSGVVGTAFFNHMFTGFFLYYTEKDKWIGEDGGLTTAIQEKANKFGIHLSVASYIDFKDLKEGDDVNFDLLGRSAFFENGVFIPHLATDRIWKNMIFEKKKKYDTNGLVGNYVRLLKLDTLAQLGGLLVPVANEAIFSGLVAFSAIIRKSLAVLTVEQANDLKKTLENFNMSVRSYEAGVFKGYVPNIEEYVYEKTGQKFVPKRLQKFQEKIFDKLVKYPQVWASLMPAITGAAKNYSYFPHMQKSFIPYWVAPYITDFLTYGAKNKRVNVHKWSTKMLAMFGEKMGTRLFKILMNLFREHGNSVVFPQFGREFNKYIKKILKGMAAQGYSTKKIKQYYDDLKRKFFNPNHPERDIEYIPDTDKHGRRYVHITSLDTHLKACAKILEGLNMTDLLSATNKGFWYLLEKGELGQRFNEIISMVLFEGIPARRIFDEHLGQTELPIVKKYREFPYDMHGNFSIYEEEYLQNQNNIMMQNLRLPIDSDLGMLTGYLTNIEYRK